MISYLKIAKKLLHQDISKTMKKRLLTIATLSFGLLCFGQSPKEIKADKAFDVYNYDKAISKYSSIDNLSTEGKRKLAESYRLTFDMQKAEEVYAELANSDDKKPEDVYYYSYILKQNQKYLESDNWMDKFKSLTSNDNRVKHYVEGNVDVLSLIHI